MYRPLSKIPMGPLGHGCLFVCCKLAIVWFVAIEMRTPDGVSQVAIWATDEWPGDGALYAVDEPAIANSIYPVATDDGIVILPDDPDLLAVSGCLAAG